MSYAVGKLMAMIDELAGSRDSSNRLLVRIGRPTVADNSSMLDKQRMQAKIFRHLSA